MLSRLHALVVPVFIAAMSLAYWVQLDGARRSAVLVPRGVLVLIGVFLVIAVVREIRSPPDAPHVEWADILAPLALIGLCIAYYVAFTTIGFDLANLGFVLASALLMGIRPARAVLLAVCTALVLFAMAWAMNFNVPDPIWAR